MDRVMFSATQVPCARLAFRAGGSLEIGMSDPINPSISSLIPLPHQPPSDFPPPPPSPIQSPPAQSSHSPPLPRSPHVNPNRQMPIHTPPPSTHPFESYFPQISPSNPYTLPSQPRPRTHSTSAAPPTPQPDTRPASPISHLSGRNFSGIRLPYTVCNTVMAAERRT